MIKKEEHFVRVCEPTLDGNDGKYVLEASKALIPENWELQ